MRKRVVQPDLFTSEKVAALPWPTVVTWVGVWCYLDDSGRGVNNAALICAAVHPLRPDYTERDVAADMARFIDDELLCPYEVGGYLFVHSTSWREHQQISHPKASKLPPCPEHEQDEWDKFVTGEGGPLGKYRTAYYRNLRKSAEVSQQSSAELPPNVIQRNLREVKAPTGREKAFAALREVGTA